MIFSVPFFLTLNLINLNQRMSITISNFESHSSKDQLNECLLSTSKKLTLYLIDGTICVDHFFL